MDRLKLMELFEKDMAELGELAARPSGYDRFKQRPDQYRYVYAESQFKIWLAGRASAEKHPC